MTTTGTCRGCGRPYAVRLDGLIRAHKSDGGPCRGSEHPPASGDLAELLDAATECVWVVHVLADSLACVQSVQWASARADRLRAALAKLGREVADERPDGEEIDAPC